MNHKLLFCLLLPVIALNSCSAIAKAHSVNSDYVVSKVIDLKGETFRVPTGKRLYFKDGARLKNGVVVGNSTTIGGSKISIFENVQIKGTWDVPNISTTMFANVDVDNVLKELFSLTSEKIKNVVTIEKGNFWLSIPSAWQCGISVNSNTEVLLDGIIRLRPNDYKGCQIMNITGSNIRIHGKGAIIGDSKTHKGTEGEWGMGINIKGGKNVNVSGVSVLNCWGDCIYIGGNSTNVHIKDCILDGGRRQGISITSAGKVYIEDCLIKNIKGTRPEYAIDVEPNKESTVDYVLIRNVKAIDCNGGFKSWHPAKNSSIGTVEIVNCSVSGNVEYYDYRFERTNKVIMKNNKGVKGKITLSSVNEAVLVNNSIRGQIFSDYRLINCKKVTKK